MEYSSLVEEWLITNQLSMLGFDQKIFLYHQTKLRIISQNTWKYISHTKVRNSCSKQKIFFPRGQLCIQQSHLKLQHKARLVHGSECVLYKSQSCSCVKSWDNSCYLFIKLGPSCSIYSYHVHALSRHNTHRLVDLIFYPFQGVGVCWRSCWFYQYHVTRHNKYRLAWPLFFYILFKMITLLANTVMSRECHYVQNHRQLVSLSNSLGLAILKGIIKAPHRWPFERSTGGRWIPLTKCRKCGKHFYAMT